MQWKSASRVTMIAIPIMIFCGLLVAASSARVDQERGQVTTTGTRRLARIKPFRAIIDPPLKACSLTSPAFRPKRSSAQ